MSRRRGAKERKVSVERNKLAVRHYVDAFNAFDLARLRNIFAEDAQIWGVMGAGNLGVAESAWHDLHHCMEVRLEILDIVAGNDDVAIRLNETGRFARPFGGLPGVEPTGKPYAVTAMEWFKFHDAKIVARWGARDSAAVYRQVTG